MKQSCGREAAHISEHGLGEAPKVISADAADRVALDGDTVTTAEWSSHRQVRAEPKREVQISGIQGRATATSSASTRSRRRQIHFFKDQHMATVKIREHGAFPPEQFVAALTDFGDRRFAAVGKTVNRVT